MTNAERQIFTEMIKTITILGAQSDLLCIVCSFGDTLTDEEVLEMLRDWNSIHGQLARPPT